MTGVQTCALPIFQPKQAQRAAEILGDIMLSLSEKESKETDKIKEFCFKQITETCDYKGELFKILGKIAFGPHSNENVTSEIVEYLFANLCKISYPYEILEGLSWAASSKNASSKLKMDVCYLFITLMEQRLPEKISEEKDKGTYKIFEFNPKTTAYTELLPVLILGLKRICLSETVSNVVRKRIIEHFLKKWEDVISCKIIWGPKNTINLAETMQDFCLNTDIPENEKIELAKALYKKVEIFTIAEMLSTIFSENTNGKLAELAFKTSEKLREFANNVEYSGAEDREIIMRCIGRILFSEKLGTVQKTEEIKEKLLFTLFEGLREEVFGVRSMLQRLQQESKLPKKLKKDIQRRLEQNIKKK